MNHRHVRALTRFWWLLVIGLGVGLFVGVGMMAHVSASIPPKVTYRSRPKYTATEKILVTSAADSVVRTQVPGAVHSVRGQSNGGKRSQQATAPSSVVAQSSPSSDYQWLVQEANFLPQLIPSDQVLALRLKMFGDLRGVVVAKATNSVTTASGKYKPGNVPIIQLDATAARPDRAIKLATSTVTAFATWLTRDQAKSHVPADQRVLIKAVEVPRRTTSSGGPKKSLAILVVFVVLAAFAGLALVLDKIPPRSVEHEAEPSADLDAEPAYEQSENGIDGQQQSRSPVRQHRRTTGTDVRSTPSEELSTLLTDEVSSARRGDGKAAGGIPNRRSE